MLNDFNPIVADQSGQFFNAFFGGEPGKRYILGINEYAQEVAGIMLTSMALSMITPMRDLWLGKPIVRLASVDPDSMVVSCVTANRPITALAKLQAAGIRRYCDYFSLANASAGRLPLVHALAETRQDHLENAAEYQWVRARLCDDESRHVFDSLMEFRLTGNLGAMAGFEYAAGSAIFRTVRRAGQGRGVCRWRRLRWLHVGGVCPPLSGLHGHPLLRAVPEDAFGSKGKTCPSRARPFPPVGFVRPAGYPALRCRLRFGEPDFGNRGGDDRSRPPRRCRSGSG